MALKQPRSFSRCSGPIVSYSVPSPSIVMGNAESSAGLALGSCFAGIASAKVTAGSAAIIAPAAAAAVLLAIRGKASSRPALEMLLGALAGASLAVVVAHADDGEAAWRARRKEHHDDAGEASQIQVGAASPTPHARAASTRRAGSAVTGLVVPQAGRDAARGTGSSDDGKGEGEQPSSRSDSEQAAAALRIPAQGTASAHRDQHWYPPTGKSKERPLEAPPGLAVQRLRVIQRGLYGGAKWDVATHSALLLEATDSEELVHDGGSDERHHDEHGSHHHDDVPVREGGAAEAGSHHLVATAAADVASAAITRRFILEYGAEADPNKVALRELPPLLVAAGAAMGSDAARTVSGDASEHRLDEQRQGTILDVDGTEWTVVPGTAVGGAATAASSAVDAHSEERRQLAVALPVHRRLTVADVEAMLCEVVQGEEYHWAHQHHHDDGAGRDAGRDDNQHRRQGAAMCPLVRAAVRRRLGAAADDGSTAAAANTALLVRQLEGALNETAHISLQSGTPYAAAAGGSGAAGAGAADGLQAAVTAAMSPRAYARAQAARSTGNA